MMRNADRDRIALVFTVNACMFIFGIVLFLMGTLLPTLKVSYAHAGNLGSIPLIGILIASVVAGPILDLHGARQLLIIALVLTAGSLILIPSLQVYWQLEVCCFAYGFGGGTLNTAANVLIADLNMEGRSKALNLLGFFFSGGAILGPLLISMTGGRLMPEMLLRILAGLTAAVLVPVLLFRFPAPRRAGIHLGAIFTVFDQPAVWLFGLLLLFESASENCMFVWSGKVVMEVLKTTPARASIALVVLGAALGIGRLVAVVWLRWLGNLGTLWVSASMVLAGVVLAVAAHTFATMIEAVAVIGLGISAIFPTVLGIAGDRFSEETGTVFGAIIALGLIGGAAGPALGGYAIGYGMQNVFWIPAVSAVSISILTAVVRRTGNEQK